MKSERGTGAPGVRHLSNVRAHGGKRPRKQGSLDSSIYLTIALWLQARERQRETEHTHAIQSHNKLAPAEEGNCGAIVLTTLSMTV